jgi:hypothetical protein
MERDHANAASFLVRLFGGGPVDYGGRELRQGLTDTLPEETPLCDQGPALRRHGTTARHAHEIAGTRRHERAHFRREGTEWPSR